MDCNLVKRFKTEKLKRVTGTRSFSLCVHHECSLFLSFSFSSLNKRRFCYRLGTGVRQRDRMSARAQDVTSKLLLDGRPANTVNLPTRPPSCRFACLPAALLALPACLPATQTIFVHPTPSLLHLDVQYRPFYLLPLSLMT